MVRKKKELEEYMKYTNKLKEGMSLRYYI